MDKDGVFEIPDLDFENYKPDRTFVKEKDSDSNTIVDFVSYQPLPIPEHSLKKFEIKRFKTFAQTRIMRGSDSFSLLRTNSVDEGKR